MPLFYTSGDAMIDEFGSIYSFPGALLQKSMGHYSLLEVTNESVYS
jgi:hypothetical protein